LLLFLKIYLLIFERVKILFLFLYSVCDISTDKNI